MPRADARARRSLSRPLPEDRAPARPRRWAASSTVAFQSRFGRAKWLEPATDTVLAGAARQGRDEGRDPRARLRRRLPGDAGGAGDPRPRHLPRRRRHAISPICPASTTAPPGMPMLRALIARELEGWRPAAIRASPQQKRRRGSWHALQSSPAAPEASARRSASRSATQGVTVAANYAGNEEKARAFTERTGIKAYKWDVADLDACLAGVAQVESELGPVDDRSSTMPASPATAR